ncbi:MAG: hypothetical protein GC186_13830 [Rhodobacteraceae bacterium]|nr:hypothetical protein [Paracoccaceae bacterium]
MFIKPIVEYAGLDVDESGRNRMAIFDEAEWGSHSYWGEIISRLKATHGLYLFYDSMTRPLYVGIAQDQSIWLRANQSYNHYRDRQLRVPMVSHPTSNVQYDPDRTRKIVRKGFNLSEVASFFSAYEVSADLIPGLEAFAIRAFGGVLLNTKIEGNGGLGLTGVEEE